MAQELGALVALPEDSGLVASTHMAVHNLVKLLSNFCCSSIQHLLASALTYTKAKYSCV